MIAGTWALARRARALDADIVQGWMYHGNMGATVARAAQRRRVPLIWGIRQSLPSLEGENGFARAGIRMSRMLSRVPDRILFNSRTSLAQHRVFGFCGDRMQHLANGFDTDRFQPDSEARVRLRAEWDTHDDECIFGLVARFHPVKDHAGFLRAARSVVEARPRTRFVMVGPGVDRDNTALATLVAQLGLQAHVHLLGGRTDVPSLMAAMDAVVSASTAEAFSNAIGEAMSCAVPCVVTAVGDSADVVGDTGFVVPARDPQALADAMVRMVDLGLQGRCELGARARARVVAQFSLEAVAGRYAALYCELTARRGALT